MTRKKFVKLTIALSIRICEKEGYDIDGQMIRKHRNIERFGAILDEHGSYKAAWEFMKPVRKAYGMD